MEIKEKLKILQELDGYNPEERMKVLDRLASEFQEEVYKKGVIQEEYDYLLGLLELKLDLYSKMVANL